MPSKSTYDPLAVLGVVAVAVGVLLRVTSLGADPSYPYWTGWITDEGRWTELARDWVLFGAPDVDSPLSRTHLVLAPVFHAAALAVFAVLGVGLVQARLLSLLAGLGVLVAAGLLLRRRIGTGPTLATVGLLAVHPDLILFSRVAIPEMPALFLELVAFAVLVAGPRTALRAFLGGLVTAAALGMKGTTAPVVPVFALVVLLVHQSDDPSSRLAKVSAFLGAIVGPAVVFLLGVGVATGSLGALLSGDGGLGDVLSFLSLDSAYGILAVLYDGAWSVRINLGLAVLWILGLVAVLRRLPRSEARAVLVGSLVWLGGWIGIWAGLVYFPERYVMHAHVPLLIAVGAGLALARRHPGMLAEALEGVRTGGSRRLVGALLSVPLAAALGPWIASALGIAGLLVPGFRTHLAVLGVVALVAGAVLARRWSAATVLGVCVAWPLAIAVLWLVAHAVGVVPERYWAAPTVGTLAAWSGLVAGGAAVAVLTAAARRRGAVDLYRVVAAYAAVLAVLAVADGVDRWAHRSRVVQEAQAFLDGRYPDSTLVGVRNGTAVLVDTPYPYRELHNGDPVPDVVVTYEPEEPEGLFPMHELVREFELSPIPRYYLPIPLRTRVRVWERSPDAPPAPPFSSGSP